MTTVLIVEQDEATRELYQRELGRSFQIITSADPAHTLQVVQEMHIDAVVLEPAVAEGAGWTLLETLSSLPTQSRLPVVICSSQDERKRGISLGAAAYLVKPVLPMTLSETLDHVLQGRPHTRRSIWPSNQP